MENNYASKQNTIFGGLDLDLNKIEETQSVKPATQDEFVDFMNNHKLQLRNDPTVQNLTSKINITNPKSILAFGEDSSVAITTISDQLLNSIKAVREEEAGELLNQLTKIMKKVDLKEVTGNNQSGFISKLFNKAKKSVEDLIARYESIGSEVEGVYMTLKRYEAEITQETENLSKLYKANVQYYKDLEKYIVAGELALEELDNSLIPQYEAEANRSNDAFALTNVNTLKNCRDMLDQRVYDLKLAENVALQSLPMIQQMQMGNFELIKTIKSSFIITLPIFKQCLISAMMIKRQENRRKNMQDLQDFTSEMIVKNAQNANRQAVELTRMNGTGIIDIEKLEESFNTIQEGIKEVRKQQQENVKIRKDGGVRLEQMKYKSLSQKDVDSNNKPNSNSGLSLDDLSL